MEETAMAILPRLGSGLLVLLLHLLTTLVLLALGALCYMGVTPFRERTLIATGNTAAGLVLAGTLIALAIPLAAMLATSHVWLDIVVWGIVAVILQLATFVAAVVVFRNLRAMIEADNVAAAAEVVRGKTGVVSSGAAAPNETVTESSLVGTLSPRRRMPVSWWRGRSSLRIAIL